MSRGRVMCTRFDYEDVGEQLVIDWVAPCRCELSGLALAGGFTIDAIVANGKPWVQWTPHAASAAMRPGGLAWMLVGPVLAPGSIVSIAVRRVPAEPAVANVIPIASRRPAIHHEISESPISDIGAEVPGGLTCLVFAGVCDAEK